MWKEQYYNVHLKVVITVNLYYVFNTCTHKNLPEKKEITAFSDEGKLRDSF